MSLVRSIAGLFKWRQFEPEVILLAVGWYLRFSLSYRDVEELLAERGIAVDHVTLWRWVQRYVPEMERRLRKRLKATNGSWPSGRDLRPGQRPMALLLPRGGFDRGDAGFSPLGQARTPRQQSASWP